MTWSHWLVPPFITSVFFVLGVVTLYWVTFSWLNLFLHKKKIKISDDTVRTWYGVIYMLVFVFTIHTQVAGTSLSWVFMNFELIAVTFCAYFLNIHIPYYFFFPIVIIYMFLNNSLGYWQSWAHAITLMIFFWVLNIVRVRYRNHRYAGAVYLAVIMPFGALLWWWMKLKFSLSWTTFLQEWGYLVIFAVLLYSYVTLVVRDNEIRLQLVEFANHDALTKTLNFSAYVADVRRLFDDSAKNDQPLSMMMFDIDHFKQINDTYGHSAGDKVLKKVTKTVEAVLAESDPKVKLYRTGGEEFNILFPGYTLLETGAIVNKIFEATNQLQIELISDTIKISISVGVSSLTSDDQAPMDLYNRVDHNLYKSKRNGRHQITLA